VTCVVVDVDLEGAVAVDVTVDALLHRDAQHHERLVLRVVKHAK
jgi:hypothetical protein